MSTDQLKKILYSVFKITLFEKSNKLHLYEPQIDINNLNIYFINKELNTNETIKIFDKELILKLRSNLIFIIALVDKNEIDVDYLYNLLISNNSKEFAVFYISLKEKIIKIQEYIQRKETISNLEKRDISDDFGRFCPICQERPCMCSDPDPD